MPRVLLLPGDGIGPEVVAEARSVLSEVAPDLEYEEALIGGCAIDAEGERYEGLARSAMVQALQRFAKYDDGAAETFAAAYVRADRRHKITNQVGGHKFIIRVRMPGEILAHNARKVDQDGAFWEFHGPAFRDRAYPLMITSRVTHESNTK